ncbi:MAG: alpha/beta fold hydrolase [Cytophagales bacterium]
MKTLFIHFDDSKLACIKFGNGEKALLCFHGYGLDKNSFLPFENKYGNEYTLYSFDLFAHGKSEYGKGDKALLLDDWKLMLDSFLIQENIERFSILAFSMGGKVALCSFELYQNKVDEVILIAPDGIKTNFWYSAATYPGFLNTFFRYTIFNPSRYFKVITLLKFLRLADKSLLKFAENEMDTATKRVRVYFSWMIYRYFRPNLENIIQISESKKIPFTFYTGTFDRIVQAKHVAIFVKRMKFVKHTDLDCGHTSLLKFVVKNS